MDGDGVQGGGGEGMGINERETIELRYVLLSGGGPRGRGLDSKGEDGGGDTGEVRQGA